MKLKHLLPAIFVAALCISCGNKQEKTEKTDIGAYQMPYLRYDSHEAEFGGNAVRETAGDFDRRKTASEASNQEYVALKDSNDYLSWTILPNEKLLASMKTGVTVRFTLPDASASLSNHASVGNLESVGQRSDIDVYVNCIKVKTVTLDSHWAWQYFVDKISEPQAEINDYPMMRFDEVHFLLDSLGAGDSIKIVKSRNDNLEIGIDFIEIESVPTPVEKPANALSVKDFGAKGDGITDDYAAFIKCIEAASEAGKTVYVPEGTFRIDTLLKLNIDNTNIQGAGMWYTNLYFGNDNFRSGAICGNANKIKISDVYIFGKNNRRLGLRDKNGKFVYTCNYGWNNRVLYQDQKGICGNFGDGSVIKNVWIEHFECGIWIAPYAWVEGKAKIWKTPEGYVLDSCSAEAEKDRTTNLRVSNVRLRNHYADGVNFSEGTSFSVFEHSDVRNCGDDGIASWSQKDAGKKTPANRGNTFRYNTVEFGWRAGGIGIFGGGGHEIHHCYVGEHILSAGIRFTADFPGSPLDTNPDNGMYVHDCIIYKCGTPADLFFDRLGAIDIHGGPKYPLNNIRFEGIQIIDSQSDGIQIWGGNINNLSFQDVTIKGTNKDGYDIASRVDRIEKRSLPQEEQKGSAFFKNVIFDKIYNENDKNFELIFK